MYTDIKLSPLEPFLTVITFLLSVAVFLLTVAIDVSVDDQNDFTVLESSFLVLANPFEGSL